MTDSIVLALKAMKTYNELSEEEEKLMETEERVIDANCNLLSRIIDYCRKNSIPFDNGLIVLLHEARKALKVPETEQVVASREIEQRKSSPRRINRTC